MKRREFILKSGLFALLSLVFDSAYAVTWAANGKVGYKEVSPNPAKKCSACKWFTADAKNSEGGLCKATAIKNVNGGGDVYVKNDGTCPMWAKKVS